MIEKCNHPPIASVTTIWAALTYFNFEKSRKAANSITTSFFQQTDPLNTKTVIFLN